MWSAPAAASAPPASPLQPPPDTPAPGPPSPHQGSHEGQSSLTASSTTLIDTLLRRSARAKRSTSSFSSPGYGNDIVYHPKERSGNRPPALLFLPCRRTRCTAAARCRPQRPSRSSCSRPDTSPAPHTRRAACRGQKNAHPLRGSGPGGRLLPARRVRESAHAPLSAGSRCATAPSCERRS